MYKKIILAITILTLTGCIKHQQQTMQSEFPNQSVTVGQTSFEQIKVFENTNDIRVDVSLPSSLQMGHFLNLKATPNLNGYFKLVVINPHDKVETVLPNQYDSGFIRANSTLYTDHKTFGIKTFPPKGLHHILVLFTQRKTPNNSILSLLQDIRSGQYGRSYIKLFALDIY